jgi:hypothetical protein
VGRRKSVEAEVVDLFCEVGEKLVGGKTGRRRSNGSILGSVDSIRFGLWDDGGLRRLLVVRGNEWLRLQDQLEILVELEFGCGG